RAKGATVGGVGRRLVDNPERARSDWTIDEGNRPDAATELFGGDREVAQRRTTATRRLAYAHARRSCLTHTPPQVCVEAAWLRRAHDRRTRLLAEEAGEHLFDGQLVIGEI